MKESYYNCYLLMTLQKILCMVISQVSWETDLFQSVDLYSEDGFEIAGCSTVTLGRESACLLFTPPRTQISLSWQSYIQVTFLNGKILGCDTRGPLHGWSSGLLRHRTLPVSRHVLSYVLNGHSSVTMGKQRPCIVII